MNVADENVRGSYDKVLCEIADYLLQEQNFSDLALKNSKYCLLDSLGCLALALSYPESTKLIGPIVEGNTQLNGARVPCTKFELDPIKAAWDIGCLIRWLDYNDTWLAAEWGHPSDNLGSLLACMDWLNRAKATKYQFTVSDLLKATIMTHEIQGILALENSFNAVGIDHVALVKIASAGVCAKISGCNREQILAVLSHAFLDGQSLRVYRHAPNTGSRKSWAAGDATSRALRLVLMVLTGEMGYPTALTAKKWGLQDVLFAGQEITLPKKLGCYVMENVLFKVNFPAEFHAQTAAEAAIKLHPKVVDQFDQIESITVDTQKSAVRIISKVGELHNPADRDHCLQYIIAVGLIFGSLKSEHYEDATAANPLIDKLREKMTVMEDPQYSIDYMDLNKRSIANKVVVRLKDGQTFSEQIHYPTGHSKRRDECWPLLEVKAKNNLSTALTKQKVSNIMNVFEDEKVLHSLPVDELISLFIP